MAGTEAKRKVRYCEGDRFAVPLQAGGYAIGVIARHHGEGLLLTYFFGYRYAKLPESSEVPALSSSEAVWICSCNGINLSNGKWPIVGHATAWDRAKWPVPTFARIDEIDGSAVQVEYSDSLKLIREFPIPSDQAKHLPEHILRGYGSVETHLTQLVLS